MLAAGGAGGGGCTHHLWLAPDDDYVSMRRRMMIRKSVKYIYFCPFIIIIISFVSREDMMHTLRSWVAFLPLFGPFSVKNLHPPYLYFQYQNFQSVLSACSLIHFTERSSIPIAKQEHSFHMARLDFARPFIVLSERMRELIAKATLFQFARPTDPQCHSVVL